VPPSTECTILVLNDDSQTESIHESIRGEFVVDILTISVVFVNCTFDDQSIFIEYELNQDNVSMPLKHYKSKIKVDEPIDENEHFVFVEGDQIQLLVPRQDLANLNMILKRDYTFDSLNDYYNDVINFFDNMTGVKFGRKYFAKADRSGRGMAYYGRFFMAQTASSLTDFFLTFGPGNWGCLHEISHSYDANFIGNIQFDFGEVWNNIFCDYYQYNRMSVEEYKTEGWLWNYGEKELVSLEIEELFENRVTLSEWNFRQKLVFISRMFYLVGHEVLMKDMFDTLIFNISNDLLDVGNDYKVIDKLVECCNRYNVDIVYLFQCVNVKVDKFVVECVKNNMQSVPYVFEFNLKRSSTNTDLVSYYDNNQIFPIHVVTNNNNNSNMIGCLFNFINQHIDNFKSF